MSLEYKVFIRYNSFSISEVCLFSAASFPPLLVQCFQLWAVSSQKLEKSFVNLERIWGALNSSYPALLRRQKMQTSLDHCAPWLYSRILCKTQGIITAVYCDYFLINNSHPLCYINNHFLYLAGCIFHTFQLSVKALCKY